MVDSADEGRKLYYDLFKHLTTLSSGSILLLVAFKEKLFPDSAVIEWNDLMGIAFFLFLLCIVSSVFTMGSYAAAVVDPSEASSIGDTSIIAVGVSTLSFLGAFVALTAFAMKNLY